MISFSNSYYMIKQYSFYSLKQHVFLSSVVNESVNTKLNLFDILKLGITAFLVSLHS